MKRLAALAVAVCCLLIAACGGSHPGLHGGRPHSQAFLRSVNAGPSPAQGLTLTPSLRGYDAVTVGNLPLNAPVAGCYVSGAYANCGAVKAREPHARLVTIATWDGATARILDTEPGDAVPAQDPGWVKRMLAKGVYRPGIYADAAEMPAVKADLAAAGLKRSQYTLWVADWNRNPAIPSGYDAIQWNSTQTLDYDTFAVSFFRPRPLPVCVHHRMTRADCTHGKRLLAKRERAAHATKVALQGVLSDKRSYGCRIRLNHRACGDLGRLERKLARRLVWFRVHAARLARSL